MDAQLKAKWVEALRSGEFKQGESYLQKRNSFCCLGVLMKIQGVEPKEVYPKTYDRMTTTLPLRFTGGLSEEAALDLGNRNDGACEYHPRKYSFAEIADYIEKNL